MNNIPKPHLQPYDDDYVLVSKRRLVAGNYAVSRIALLLSGVTNSSHLALIVKFTREAIAEIGTWSQDKIDNQIQKILESYNQPPNN
ncbi:hypothetical protein [Anabaena sp. UHCC 0451]|uniref:hypothetical protein n=1 Tax=Anabaena sp. UHCC 0451 TaxID=2055235 RepID=UPI002B22056D|nr:hypothetical protein [Anabaena sp. UHCC 0451]MEA5579546.1 hypothetical protein [Anabaena sp. UHCC 0451]